MALDIYALGSHRHLADIFEGISIIMGYDTNGANGGVGALNPQLIGFLSVSFAIGIIFQIMQALNSGKGAGDSIQKTLMAYLIFLIVFGASTSVNVRDAANPGKFYRVDGVPLGIAYTASFTTTSARWIGTQFLFAWPSPSALQTGDYDPYNNMDFVSSLKAIAGLHNLGNSYNIQKSINASTGLRDATETVKMYVQQCTLRGADRGATTADIIAKASIPEGLKFESELYTVGIEKADGSFEDLNCTDAYNKYIGEDSADTTISYYEALTQLDGPARKELLALVNITNAGDYNTAGELTLPDSNANDSSPELKRIGNHLSEINMVAALGSNLESAQRSMMTAIVRPIYDLAARDRHVSLYDNIAAVMVNQGISQRNIQWASEQSMFMSVIKPMTSFFEGFLYAIAPLLAAMILMGFGARMLPKYLQFLVGIQLWIPTLILIDRFITNGVKEKVAAFSVSQSGNASMNSFYVMDGVMQEVQAHIATGGMLAASAPMLTMLLVYGSPIIANSLAQRMGGQDHINERLMAPDVANAAPVMSQQSYYTSDAAHGTARFGEPETGTEVNMANQLAHGAQMAQNNLVAASSTMQASLAKTFTEGQSNSHIHTLGKMSTEAATAAASETNSTSISQMQSAMETAGVSQADQNTIIGSYSAGISLPKSVITEMFSAGAEAKNMDTQTMGQLQDATSTAGESLKNDTAYSAAYTETMAELVSKASQEQHTAMESLGVSDSLLESSSDIISSTKSLSTYSDDKSSIGTIEKFNTYEMAKRVADSENGLTNLNQNYNNALSGLSKEERILVEDNVAAQTARYISDEIGMGNGAALARAQMEALASDVFTGSDDSLVQAAGYNGLIGAYEDATGKNIGTRGAEQLFSEEEQKGLGEGVDPGAATTAFNAGLGETIEDKTGTLPVIGSPPDVSGQADANRLAVNAQAAEHQGQFNNYTNAAAAWKAHDQTFDYGSTGVAASLFGGAENLNRFSQMGEDTAGEVSTMAGELYSEARSSGLSHGQAAVYSAYYGGAETQELAGQVLRDEMVGLFASQGNATFAEDSDNDGTLDRLTAAGEAQARDMENYIEQRAHGGSAGLAQNGALAKFNMDSGLSTSSDENRDKIVGAEAWKNTVADNWTSTFELDRPHNYSPNAASDSVMEGVAQAQTSAELHGDMSDPVQAAVIANQTQVSDWVANQDNLITDLMAYGLDKGEHSPDSDSKWERSMKNMIDAYSHIKDPEVWEQNAMPAIQDRYAEYYGYDSYDAMETAVNQAREANPEISIDAQASAGEKAVAKAEAKAEADAAAAADAAAKAAAARQQVLDAAVTSAKQTNIENKYSNNEPDGA